MEFRKHFSMKKDSPEQEAIRRGDQYTGYFLTLCLLITLVYRWIRYGNEDPVRLYAQGLLCAGLLIRSGTILFLDRKRQREDPEYRKRKLQEVNGITITVSLLLTAAVLLFCIFLPVFF